MTIEDSNNIANTLVVHLKAKGVDGTNGVAAIYANNSTPTTALPESFLEVLENGPVSSPVSEYGIRECALLLILNVRLAGDGAKNITRENYLLGKISDAIKVPFSSSSYHYSLDKKNLVYSGRDLYAGYSSKTISINVKIY